MFSIFSVKAGNDVPTAWLLQHKQWAVQCKSTWFAFALERGSKENNLHVQGVMECRIFATKAGCDVLRESLKLMMNIHSSDNAKIEVKACQAGQTATYMLGYIQKDKSKAHYDVSMHLCCCIVCCCHACHLLSIVLAQLVSTETVIFARLSLACIAQLSLACSTVVHCTCIACKYRDSHFCMQIAHSDIPEAILLNASKAY